jgi:hypothetical protein
MCEVGCASKVIHESSAESCKTLSKVLEVNADKTKYVVIARDCHAGQNNYMDMGNNILRGWKNLDV